MPVRLTNPTVGFRPTRPLTADGQMMLPSVSVPTPAAAKLAAIAVPVPELEPHGLRSSTYGFFVWPPRELQPDDERVERKFAHSERLVLPMITAPASRRRFTMNASTAGRFSASAIDPAEFTMPAMSTLSLMSTGMPCIAPRTLPAFRSASSACASAIALGFSSITESSRCPPSSTLAMRSRYACVSASDVTAPDAIRSRASVADSSTTSRRAGDAGPREPAEQAATPVARMRTNRPFMSFAPAASSSVVRTRRPCLRPRA